MSFEKKPKVIYNGCAPLELSEEQLEKLASKFGFEITEEGIQKIKTPNIQKEKNI